MDVADEPDDPTIRDKMENGAVFTRPRYPRIRVTYKINYELLTGEDKTILEDFRAEVGGWMNFTYTDRRVPDQAPRVLNVRFSKLPVIADDKYADGEKRFKCTFEVTEV
jgi:hypothetical protein